MEEAFITGRIPPVILKRDLDVSFTSVKGDLASTVETMVESDVLKLRWKLAVLQMSTTTSRGR